jgi:ferrochelatase
MAAERVGVLLMAYGSPDRLEDVEPYYVDIRGGRKPSDEAISELSHKYAQVGIPTPLLRVSRSLAQNVEKLLNEARDSAGGVTADGARRFMVRLGMKHWTPRIEAAVTQLLEGGIDRLLAAVLAPHYSSIGTEGYRRQVQQALGESERAVPLDFVDSWHELDGYIEAVAQNVEQALSQFADRRRVMVVFTAHSLPARILEQGDPYKVQLLRSSELIAEKAGVSQWQFSFQSQSQTGEPWLGPDLLDTLEELARSGVREVLVAPVGFIADHLEIFYDIDIEAIHKAGELGIELRRTAMLNDDPRLAKALAGLVRDRIGQAAAGARS